MNSNDTSVAVSGEDEEYVSIAGFEGMYEVSSKGNVRSIKSSDSYRKGLVLAPVYKNGYKYVGLVKNGITKQVTMHRLVGMAFIPNPLNKPAINHKNSDRGDNRVSNLEWVTYAENTEHSRVQGKADRYQNSGERHGMAKLTVIQAVDIFDQRFTGDKKALAAKYGVHPYHVRDIWAGKKWARAIERLKAQKEGLTS